MELESFMRGQGKFSYLGWGPKEPKSYKKTNLNKKIKTKKNITNNLKEKEFKNMKLEELGSLLQVVMLFVCPLPPIKARTQWIYICENLEQEIRGF
jgi:hypothetical protein